MTPFLPPGSFLPLKAAQIFEARSSAGSGIGEWVQHFRADQSESGRDLPGEVVMWRCRTRQRSPQVGTGTPVGWTDFRVFAGRATWPFHWSDVGGRLIGIGIAVASSVRLNGSGTYSLPPPGPAGTTSDFA